MKNKTTQQLLRDLISAGKSQHEISRQTGVPQSTLSRILNGVNKLPFSRFHGDISNYYNQILGSDIQD